MNNARIGKLNIVLFILIIVLSIGIVASTGLYNVSIRGLTRYDPSEFYDMLGHEGIFSNTLAFWIKNKIDKKEDIPFVDTYTVTLIDKNTVAIRVYENDVVGCIEVMGSYFCFDKDGFITESTATRPDGVPAVTGLEFDEAVVFKQLNIQKQSLFEVVLSVTKLLKKYGIPIEEINFNSFNEVTLYMGDLEILLGKKKEYDTALSALDGVYEKAAEIGGTLDLRNYSEENTDIVLKTSPKKEKNP
ncbi:MAG: hypothetical protein K6F63_04845 [Lachnospiraceae bacterium]|nr:hypothetical protein [Lachnospiraceae bacterium]